MASGIFNIQASGGLPTGIPGNNRGFELTLSKVAQSLKVSLQPGDTQSADYQRVKALATTVWQYIQEKKPAPISEAELNRDIDAWMQGVKVIELSRSMNAVVFLNNSGRIGNGGESIVYKGVLDPTGESCAVKHMNNDNVKEDEVIKRLDTIFKQICQDRYLVHYYGFCDDFEKDAQGNYVIDGNGDCVFDGQYLVEELASGSLFNLSEKAENGDVAARNWLNSHLLPFIGQILEGVSFMHQGGYVHGDIKLDNILLSQSQDEIRISDLGGVYVPNDGFSQLNRPRAGTIHCYAPEQVAYFKDLFGSILNPQVVQSPGHISHCLESEVWQVMLMIAEMGKNQLSQPFRDRIEDYLLTYRGHESDAEDAALIDPRFNGRNFAYIKGILYTALAQNEFIALQNQRTGLFSDLEPTNRLETILMGMSAFDPDQRITAQQAHEMFREYY